MKNIEKKLSDILPTILPSLKVVSWEGKKGVGFFTTREETCSETPVEVLAERWGFVRGCRYETAPIRYKYIGDEKDPHVKIKNGSQIWFIGFKSVEKRGKFFRVDTDKFEQGETFVCFGCRTAGRLKGDKFEQGETFAIRGPNGTYATFERPENAQEWVAQNSDLIEKMRQGEVLAIASAQTKAGVEYSPDFDTVCLRRGEQGFSLVVTRFKHEGAGQANGSYRRWAVVTEMEL